MDDGRFRIGELSERYGLSTAAVRYYERLGLLTEPERSPSGYRLFTADDEARLRFILRGKALDLSLEEIRSLLDAWHDGRCQETRMALRHLIAHKIREAQARAREAETFAIQLTHVYERLGQDPVSDAGSCGCIPDLPAPTTHALLAELAQIDHSVCDCGGRIEGSGCPCGCCAPTTSTGGGDSMSDTTLTENTQQSGGGCACCAPVAEAPAAEAPTSQSSGCNCGSGSSEGCGEGCTCGTASS
ncbi:MAG: MerR family DNA-binding transcriptional regulator [Actinobacteria bacterium]|nr:MerR family DNA-binding transcriptional regulator [Actinomycetota bacterium]